MKFYFFKQKQNDKNVMHVFEHKKSHVHAP